MFLKISQVREYLINNVSCVKDYINFFLAILAIMIIKYYLWVRKTRSFFF